MMLLTFKKVLLAIASIVLIASCSKDKDNNNSSYPKQVTIEYKLTSTTGITAATVTFTNETGGQDDIDNAALPFSKKITATVDRYDVLSFIGYSPVGGSTKYEILVNDKVISSQTFSGTSGFAGSISHIFN